MADDLFERKRDEYRVELNNHLKAKAVPIARFQKNARVFSPKILRELVLDAFKIAYYEGQKSRP